jgi:hypothetical protein
MDFDNFNQDDSTLGERESAEERFDDLHFAVHGVGIPPWLSQEETLQRILLDFPLKTTQVNTLRSGFNHLDARIRREP